MSFGPIVGLYGILIYVLDVITHWLCELYSPVSEIDIKREFCKDYYQQSGACNFGNHTFKMDGKMNPEYDLYDQDIQKPQMPITPIDKLVGSKINR